MTERRFELKLNQHNQWGIVDWVESKEKNAICVYNDLGDYRFSSAKALCELLNELVEDNNELRIVIDTLKVQNMKFKAKLNDLGVEYYD